MRRLKAFFIAGLLLIVSQAALANSKKFTLSAGHNYSTGDYGQSVPTQVHYTSVIGKWVQGAWTMKLTIPYLRISGPGVVVGGVPVGTPKAKSTEEGLGDIAPSLSWSHRLNTSGTTAELAGILKLPTADEERNLGTGLTDLVLQINVVQPIGNAYLTGSIGRKLNGSNSRFPMKDTWKATAGAGFKISDNTTIGAMYDYREAQTDTSDELGMVTAYGSYKLSQDWSVQFYGSAGLTNTAPDSSIGFQISKNFDLW